MLRSEAVPQPDVELVVVWHGAMPSPYGGFTKGELLEPRDSRNPWTDRVSSFEESEPVVEAPARAA